MPTSTLHKSAQQGAPDAYISLCKSTIQDMRVPRRYTCPSLHAPRGACISLARVQKMSTPASYAHSRDTRAASYACVQDMHAPLRASKTCTCRPLPACAKDGHANRDRAKMHVSLLL